MIPGMHYNIDKEEVIQISTEQAWRNFYGQMLTGDSTDNIPGLYGVGKITAKKILSEISDPHLMQKAVKHWYKKCYPELSNDKLREIFLEIGTLLWIRRKEDEIWEPL